MSNRIFLSFKEDDPIENRAYEFLDEIGRCKSAFISRLVCDFIDKNACTDSKASKHAVKGYINNIPLYRGEKNAVTSEQLVTALIAAGSALNISGLNSMPNNEKTAQMSKYEVEKTPDNEDDFVDDDLADSMSAFF